MVFVAVQVADASILCSVSRFLKLSRRARWEDWKHASFTNLGESDEYWHRDCKMQAVGAEIMVCGIRASRNQFLLEKGRISEN